MADESRDLEEFPPGQDNANNYDYNIELSRVEWHLVETLLAFVLERTWGKQYWISMFCLEERQILEKGYIMRQQFLGFHNPFTLQGT